MDANRRGASLRGAKRRGNLWSRGLARLLRIVRCDGDCFASLAMTGPAPHRREFGRRKARIGIVHEPAAVGRKALEQYLGKGLRRAAASGAYVAHEFEF